MWWFAFTKLRGLDYVMAQDVGLSWRMLYSWEGVSCILDGNVWEYNELHHLVSLRVGFPYRIFCLMICPCNCGVDVNPTILVLLSVLFFVYSVLLICRGVPLLSLHRYFNCYIFLWIDPLIIIWYSSFLL